MNRRSSDYKPSVTRPLSLKLSVFVAVMCLVMGALLVLVSYQIHGRYISDQFAQRGETVASVASRYVNWDKIAEYYETGVADEEYAQTLADLRAIADAEGAKYIYVIVPAEGGVGYVYDTDSSEDQVSLGTFIDYDFFFGGTEQAPVIGEAIEPFYVDADGEELLCVYFPNYKSSGGFAGYLGVDYDASHLAANSDAFLMQLIAVALVVALIATVGFYIILRQMIVRPIDKMAVAAADYVVTHDEGAARSNKVAQLSINTKDELQSLSKSLKGMDSTIKEHIASLESANIRAATDSMTGLLNREAFTYQVTELIEGDDKGEAHTFMMVDLDNFKEVNDTHGHLIGDEVIQETASIIVAKFRASDLISRFGGDEYAVYYRHATSLEEVEKRVQDVCLAVRENMITSELSVSVSIGVAYLDDSAEYSFQELYIMADTALYDAKSSGRNGYVIREKNS